MFAGLLRLELRRTEPGEVTGLHAAAAGWLAARGFAVEAVRHAQAAEDWELAARLLAGHWPGLYLDGQAAAVHELLAGFPAGLPAADAGLAVVAAADELAQGSLEAAERYLALAERQSASGPAGRGDYGRLLLGVVRLLLDRQRGNLPAVAADARDLQAMAEVADAAQPGLGADLSALALISLGSTEFWATASHDAERYLDRGIALARQGGRPYLEFTGLAYQALHEFYHSFARAAERGRAAVELAERHGWTGDPAVGIACTAVAAVLAWQGQPDEAEPWVQRAERTLTADTQPAAVLAIRYIRGTLELERGRNAAALAALEAGERAGPAARRAALLRRPATGLAGACPDPPRPGRAGRAVPGRARRAGPRARRDPRRRRGAAAGPGRPAGRARRARPHPAGLRRRGLPGILAGPGGHAGGDRPGRARRPGCRRRRPRARTGPVRGQRRPDPVPAVSRCGPAGASCPAPHRPRRPGRRDPRPARREGYGGTGSPAMSGGSGGDRPPG